MIICLLDLNIMTQVQRLRRHCPTPLFSPTYLPRKTKSAENVKPYRKIEIWKSFWTIDWSNAMYNTECLRMQPSRCYGPVSVIIPVVSMIWK